MRIKWFSFVRITGLLLVLVYHFFKPALPGGFVGVDVFFTFSGYLITALLIDEFAREKRIKFVAFLRRRFYRIVPPLVGMVLVTTPLALLVRDDFAAGIGQQVAAAVGFVTNYYEILLGGSYETQFAPHLFLHTWSLAVEMHYYILWGAAVFLLSKVTNSAKSLRVRIFVVSAALFIASYLAMAIGAQDSTNLSIQYFSTQTHIFPFFVGSALACFAGIATTSARFTSFVTKYNLKQALLAAAISAVVLFVLGVLLTFDDIHTYRFGFLLASLAAATMVLATRVLHEKTPQVKEPKIVSYFADTSYGVYLFHWPLFNLLSEKFDPGTSAAITVALSLALASLSFYVIEPLLAGRTSCVLGRTITLKQALKPLSAVGGLLLAATLYTSVTAPTISSFQLSNLSNGAIQADNHMSVTRKMADSAQASNYNVTPGVTYIGDSVSLRAISYLQKAFPEAQIDATVSRNVSMGADVLETDIANNAVMQDIVVALGTNPVGGTEAIDRIVEMLPKGHRLIFVTPHDGRHNDPSSGAAAIRAYELQLAEKYDYIYIADWHQTAVDHPELWPGTDNVHFGSDSDTINAGGELFATTVADALAKADQGPVKP